MEVITDGQSRREMEQSLAALQTSLNMVKTSITKFENLMEDYQMVEEELRWIEEDKAHQEEEEEPLTSRWSTRKNTILCVLIHHATIWAECYLLLLVVIIIDRYLGQALCFVELVNHILPFILKRHIWRYDGYQ